MPLSKSDLSGHTANDRGDPQLVSELAAAIEGNNFFLLYQPQFDLENSRLTGAEALLRWRHPVRGIVPPMQFIPVAEQSGLIVDIGLWVLREACSQLRKYRIGGVAPLQIAINVSPQQFVDPSFVESVDQVLKTTGIDPNLVEFEITEGTIMRQVDQSMASIGALRSMGIRFAIDDFGTGYSSLSQLQRLSLNTLKIDRFFVNDLEINARAIQLVESLIALGHSLGMTVVGEGIEEQSQLNALRSAGCDMGQGYLLGRPTEPEEIARIAQARGMSSSKPTILLVEDEEMVLRLARQVLRADGYTVFEARNGRDALAIVEKQGSEIDILITDLYMPAMNGDELARLVRAQQPHMKIVFISGYAYRDSERFIEPGIVELAKPFGGRQLLDAVRQVLQ